MAEESTTTLSPKEERERKAAKDVIDRSEREIRRLTQVGVDVSALADRFESARSLFGQGRWSDAEMTCSEILILAKSMQAITSASMKAEAAAPSKKISESMKQEVSRLIVKEVSDRIEAVARTLPTKSSLAEEVENKIQEALVTGGLIQRLENIAAQKAKASVAGIPRFTGKDAQAAAKVVVMRSLTQFLASKDLGKKIAAAVEGNLTKSLEKTHKQVVKELTAQLNTQLASIVEPLPTKKGVDKQVSAALIRFIKEEPFEERVLKLAAERAKAEVERAPDLMSEAASKIAREAADDLFKTHVRSKEFGARLQEIAHAVADEVAEASPSLSAEDVEVIARRIGEESLASLAESDVLREKMVELGNQSVGKALSAKGFDEKLKALAGVVAKQVAKQVVEATPHVTPEELEQKLGGTLGQLEERTKALEQKLGEGLAEKSKELDGRMAALEQKLGGGLAEKSKELDGRIVALEEKLGEGLAEKSKELDGRTAALEERLQGLEEAASDALSEEEVGNRILESRRELMTNEDFGEWLKDGTLAVLREVGLAEGMPDLEGKYVTPEEAEEAFVSPEKAGKIARHEALTAAMDMLETNEFTRRVVELLGEDDVREQLSGIGGGGEDLELQVKNALAELLESDELVERVKEITGGAGEDLQKELVGRVDRIEKEMLPEIVENAVAEKLGTISTEGIETKIQEALAGRLDGDALNQQILGIAQQSIGKIANTPEFKEMLEDKFKIMVKYLSENVIPKQIRRQMGGG